MSARIDVVMSSFASGFVQLAEEHGVPNPRVVALRAHAMQAFADLRELLRDVHAHRHATGRPAPSIEEVAAIAHAQVALLIRDAVIITGAMRNPSGPIVANFVLTASSDGAGRYSFSAGSTDHELAALFRVIGLAALTGDRVGNERFTWPFLGEPMTWLPGDAAADPETAR